MNSSSKRSSILKPSEKYFFLCKYAWPFVTTKNLRVFPGFWVLYGCKIFTCEKILGWWKNLFWEEISLCLQKSSLIVKKSLDCGKIFASGKLPWSWRASLIVEKFVLVENFFDCGKIFSCWKIALENLENFLDCGKVFAC